MVVTHGKHMLSMHTYGVQTSEQSSRNLYAITVTVYLIGPLAPFACKAHRLVEFSESEPKELSVDLLP